MEERENKGRLSSDRREGVSRRYTEVSRPRTAKAGAGREGAAAKDGKARRRRPESDIRQAQRERTQRRQVSAGTEVRRPGSRKQQAKRRRKRNLGLKIAFLIIFIIAAVAAVFLWKRYSPSKERADRNEYYGIKNENQMAVIVNNEVVEPTAMIAEGKAYVQYETVRDYMNSRFYWDPSENILLYTLPNDTVSVGVGSRDYTISKEKNSKDYVILKTEGNTAYIALDFVQQYTNIEYEVYDDPSRVMVDRKSVV